MLVCVCVCVRYVFKSYNIHIRTNTHLGSLLLYCSVVVSISSIRNSSTSTTSSRVHTTVHYFSFFFLFSGTFTFYHLARVSCLTSRGPINIQPQWRQLMRFVYILIIILSLSSSSFPINTFYISCFLYKLRSNTHFNPIQQSRASATRARWQYYYIVMYFAWL